MVTNAVNAKNSTQQEQITEDLEEIQRLDDYKQRLAAEVQEYYWCNAEYQKRGAYFNDKLSAAHDKEVELEYEVQNIAVEVLNSYSCNMCGDHQATIETLRHCTKNWIVKLPSVTSCAVTSTFISSRPMIINDKLKM